MARLDWTERLDRRMAKQLNISLDDYRLRKAKNLERALQRAAAEKAQKDAENADRRWLKSLSPAELVAEKARRKKVIADWEREQTRQRRKEWWASRGGRAALRPAPAVRAIETHYQGYRFRSRLEARWAVAFTAQGIEWDYEPEGFELPSGRYLPDFWLPQVSMWAEVKPTRPTDRELRLAKELAVGSGHPVLLLIGQPDDLAYWAEMPSPNQYHPEYEFLGPKCWQEDFSPFHSHYYHLSESRFYMASSMGDSSSWPMPFKNETWGCGPIPPGVAAARAARFEHGETPP
jgi:hypothetical protein